MRYALKWASLLSLYERPNTKSSKSSGERRDKLDLLIKEIPGKHLNEEQVTEEYNKFLENICICLAARDFLGADLYLLRLYCLHRLKYYPSKKQRVALVEIILEAIRNHDDVEWCRHMKNLLANLIRGKNGPFIDIDDLHLDWRSHFDSLCKYQKSRLSEYMPNKNAERKELDIDIAEVIHLFTPAEEIPEILERCIEMYEFSDTLGAATAASLLFSLFPTLPPRINLDLKPQFYLPVLFKLWSYAQTSWSYNNAFFSLMSRIARDQIENSFVSDFDGFGIFTEQQSKFLSMKAIQMFKIPVMGQVNSNKDHLLNSMIIHKSLKEKDGSSIAFLFSRMIIYSLSPACSNNDANILTDLQIFLHSVRSNLHPSNSTHSTQTLTEFLAILVYDFCSRYFSEQENTICVTDQKRITPEVKVRFVRIIRDAALLAMYNNSNEIRSIATKCLGMLSNLEPDLVIPAALKRIYPSLKSVLETTRTQAAMELLLHLIPALVRSRRFRPHLLPLLELCLPGIDPNDFVKTEIAFDIFETCFQLVPVCQLEENADSILAESWLLRDLSILENLDMNEEFEDQIDSDLAEHLDPDMLDQVSISASSMFLEFSDALFERLFVFFDSLYENSEETWGESLLNLLIHLFSNCHVDIAKASARKLFKYIDKESWHSLSFICNISKTLMIHKNIFINIIIPQLVRNIEYEIEEHEAGSDRSSTADHVLPRDRTLVFNLQILKSICETIGESFEKFSRILMELLRLMNAKLNGYCSEIANEIVAGLIEGMIEVYTIDRRLSTEKIICDPSILSLWGKIEAAENIQWHIPTKNECEFALKLFRQQMSLCLEALNHLVDQMEDPDLPIPIETSLATRYLQTSALISVSGKLVSLEAEEDLANLHLDPSDEKYERYRVLTDLGTILPADFCWTGSTDKDLRLTKIEYAKIEDAIILQYEKLLQRHPDSLRCIGFLLKTIEMALCVKTMPLILYPLDDNLDALDKQKFEVPGLSNTKPRSLAILSVIKTQFRRIQNSVCRKPVTNKQLQMINFLIDQISSPYSAIRIQAQISLNICCKNYIGISTYLNKRLAEIVEIDDKSSLRGGLHMVAMDLPTITVSEDLRQKFIWALLKAQKYDNSTIKTYSALLISSFAVPSYRYSRKSNYKAEKLKLWPLSQPAILQTKSLSEALDLEFSQNLDKAENFAMQMIIESEKEHWRNSQFMLSFAALSFNIDDRMPPNEILQKFAEKTLDEQPAMRLLGISIIGSLMPILYIKSRFETMLEANSNDFLLDGESIKAISQHPDKFEFQQDFLNDNSTEYYDDYSFGWMVWPKQTRVFNLDYKKQNCKYIDQVKGTYQMLAQFFNKPNFLQLVEYLTNEPRNSESSNFRIRKQALQLFIWLWDLEEYHPDAIKISDAKEIVENLFSDDKKFRHRVGMEILSSLVISHTYKTKQKRESLDMWLIPLLNTLIGAKINQDNLAFFKSFIRLTFESSDMRRNLGIYKLARDLKLDLNSDEAFNQASRIALLRKAHSARNWMIPKDIELLDMMINNFESPYKKVRQEIGDLLAEQLQQLLLPPYTTSKMMIEQMKFSTDFTHSTRYLIDPVFNEIFERVFKILEDARINRDIDEASMKEYILVSKTMTCLVDSFSNSHDPAFVFEIFGDRIYRELLYMLDVKSDSEMREQAAGTLMFIANLDLSREVFDKIIEEIDVIAKTSSVWNHKLHSISTLMCLIWTQLLNMSEERTQKVLEIINTLLHDERIEVRHAAVLALTSLIFCVPLNEDRLVKTCIENFSDELFNTSKADFRHSPYHERKNMNRREFESPVQRNFKETSRYKFNNDIESLYSGEFSNQKMQNSEAISIEGSESDSLDSRSNAILQRHAAVLGLSAVLSSCPYDTPPWWMPSIVALLSECTHEVNPIGISAKKALEKFRKLRSDTWAYDQKFFTQEQLENLSGITSHNYFT